MQKAKLFILITSLCVFVYSLFISGVQAAQIELPITVLPRITYTGPRTVLIPQFDPSLGDLQSASINYSSEISGTVSGYSGGSANEPNGWAIEFSGEVRFYAPLFGSDDKPHFASRSGLVWQPNTPVYEFFQPRVLTHHLGPIEGDLSLYIGDGTVSGTLSWPVFVSDLFWSRSGTGPTTTRELGGVGGTITYVYEPRSGDCDGDGDVDLGDYAGFETCFDGPNVDLESGCECFDFDVDGDVDLNDFSLFQGYFTQQ